MELHSMQCHQSFLCFSETKMENDSRIRILRILELLRTEEIDKGYFCFRERLNSQLYETEQQ